MSRILPAATLFALALSGCASTPTAPPVPPPELVSQELAVEQDLTNFRLNFEGRLRPEQDAVVERAEWELVVEGEVTDRGQAELGVEVPAGETKPFLLKARSQYVSSAEQLQSLSAQGGSLLAALRGTLHVRQGGTVYPIAFARSREVRTPRLPTVVMQELDAARYSSEEANIIFRIGVVNPNPFPLRLGSVSYEVQVAGRKIGEGVRGTGEHVAPSATGMFEVQLPVSQATWGPDIKKLIATTRLPYVVTGEVKGELYAVPYQLEGTVQLYGTAK
jgi:LEA14-like dessication related protein